MNVLTRFFFVIVAGNCLDKKMPKGKSEAFFVGKVQKYLNATKKTAEKGEDENKIGKNEFNLNSNQIIHMETKHRRASEASWASNCSLCVSVQQKKKPTLILEGQQAEKR